MSPDNATESTSRRHLFLAFSTFTGDRADFDTWYDGEHIPQVMSGPGMVGAQRFILAGTKPLPGVKALDFGHLALYELNGSPDGFREDVKRMLISGEMVLPEFMVQPFTALFLKPVSAEFGSPALEAGASLDNRHLLLVWSRHTGDDDTFAKWYDEEHIPAFMATPGMLRAQRFEVADTKPLPGVVVPDLGHLALYEIDGDAGGLREEVKRQLMSGEMVLPDFMIPPFEAMFLAPVSKWARAEAPVDVP